MQIAMIGAGCVGLVSGAYFSDFPREVTFVDLDESKLERLRQGQMPIIEPGLDLLVKSNMDARRVGFTTDSRQAVTKVGGLTCMDAVQ